MTNFLRGGGWLNDQSVTNLSNFGGDPVIQIQMQEFLDEI